MSNPHLNNDIINWTRRAGQAPHLSPATCYMLQTIGLEFERHEVVMMELDVDRLQELTGLSDHRTERLLEKALETEWLERDDDGALHLNLQHKRPEGTDE